MDEADRAIRNLTYAAFADLGRAPTSAEVAERGGQLEDDVRSSWRRLHEQHALVLLPDADRIWMANPFSGVPTPYRVLADGRWWFANCGWDAFGICAALHADGTIETACPECDDPIRIGVRDARPDDTGLVFHCLVPARAWWDDIGAT